MEWIHVSKALPQAGHVVLVCGWQEYPEAPAMDFAFRRNTNGEWYFSNAEDGFAVEYWAECPFPAELGVDE